MDEAISASGNVFETPGALATASAAPRSETKSLSPGQKWLSFGEFLLGAAIVIGHNVYQVIPNEVPILFLIGLVSFRLRERSWTAMGLGRPMSWRRTLLIAVAAAFLRIALSAAVTDPLTAHFWPAAKAPAGMNEITGHAWVALRWLGLIWTFAAFGEEIGYRGYLLNRAADVGGRTKFGYWAGVAAVAVLFGYGHYYKGPAGIIDSGMAGLILGAAYVLSGRNLWACILAHGLIDTVGVVAVFFGWAS
jgi:membrane protease YdiL (CAAX protease family)